VSTNLESLRAEQEARLAKLLEELAEQSARAVEQLMAEEDSRQAAYAELAARQEAALAELNHPAE
jgi:hypothetical protein